MRRHRGLDGAAARILLFRLPGKDFTDVLHLLTNILSDLDNDAATIQPQFFAVFNVIVAKPVCVAYEISPFIVNDDPLVKGVEFQPPILPSFLFSFQIVRVQAHKIADDS
jgi:hypothetical protein